VRALVWVEPSVCVGLQRLVDTRALQDTEVDQPATQDPDHRLVHGGNGSPGSRRGDARLFRGEDDVVQVALMRREGARSRKRSGDVGAVHSPLGAGIQKNEVALRDSSGVGDIVEYGCVGSGSGNGQESWRAGT